MTTPATPRRRARRWLLILLALMVVVAASVATIRLLNPFGINPFARSDSSELGDGERLIPVRFDSLLNEISINGSITFPTSQDMTFGSRGTVDELLVHEGEVVTPGQPLARLDPESVFDLQSAIAQAQLDYREMQDALEDAEQPAVQIAEAEASVSTAATELRNAQEALEDLLDPKRKDIADAEANLANAAVELQDAQEALDELLNPKTDALAGAEEAVRQAQVAVREAEFALGNDFAVANANYNAAKQQSKAAQYNLDQRKNTNQLKEVQDIYDEERQDYLNVIYKWTGAKVTDDELAMTPEDLFSALDFDPYQVYSAEYALFPDGHIADNPQTRWNELKVFGWRVLYPGVSLIEVQCDQYTLAPLKQSDTSNTNAELCIQRDMDSAYESFTVARNELNSALAQHEESIAQAEASLINAANAEADAKEALDRLASGSIGEALLQAEFAKAQADLDAAIQNLNELTNPSDAELENKRKQIELAQANKDAAEEDLRTLMNPEAQEITRLHDQVALAQANFDAATLSLDRLENRRELEIKLKEAEVASALAKVDGATRRYEDSTLNAPWDGYVSAIPVEIGEEVEPFEVIMSLINSGIIQVAGSVDEIDVLSLERGAPATVTIDALPDQTLDGIITNISSTATNQQGVVTFDVTIEVSISQDITLQEGLSAIAKVGVSEERGILIPLQAVQYGEQGAYVRMEDETGSIVERSVSLGSSDGFWTIVEDGLVEGDRIAMQVLNNPEFELGAEDGANRPPPGGRGPGFRARPRQ